MFGLFVVAKQLLSNGPANSHGPQTAVSSCQALPSTIDHEAELYRTDTCTATRYKEACFGLSATSGSRQGSEGTREMFAECEQALRRENTSVSARSPMSRNPSGQFNILERGVQR